MLNFCAVLISHNNNLKIFEKTVAHIHQTLSFLLGKAWSHTIFPKQKAIERLYVHTTHQTQDRETNLFLEK